QRRRAAAAHRLRPAHPQARSDARAMVGADASLPRRRRQPDRTGRNPGDRKADARPFARPAGGEGLGAARSRRARPPRVARAPYQRSGTGFAHHACDCRGAASRRAYRHQRRPARALRRHPVGDQGKSEMNGSRPGGKLVRALLLLGVPLVVIVAGLHFYAQGGRHMETDNAYVKAHIVAVSAEVAGRVAEVAVRDNQTVEPGQLLFRIDPAPFEMAVARANAQLANARTEVETLRAEHRVALADAEEAEERIRFLTLQLERQRRLKEQGMVREEAYDEARHNLDAARARLTALQERVARGITGLGGDLKLPTDRHPRVLEARAALDTAALDLARTRILA